jgi:hypothetical protein
MTQRGFGDSLRIASSGLRGSERGAGRIASVSGAGFQRAKLFENRVFVIHIVAFRMAVDRHCFLPVCLALLLLW